MKQNKRISDLNQLIDELESCNGDYESVGQRIDISGDKLLQYAVWDKNHYTRVCLARNEKYELLLLCWESDQVTPVHCHNQQECWVYLAKGKFEERRYEHNLEELNILEVEHLEKTQKSYMNDDRGMHSLHNTADGRAMSLHLYVGPIDNCHSWNPQKEKFTLKELEYDAIHNLLTESD